MMFKQSMDSRMEEAKISLDALVPKNHLVRKLTNHCHLILFIQLLNQLTRPSVVLALILSS